MKLTSIHASNFKGRDFSFKLAPVQVFTGPNFGGKTAVLDAIRVGLIGYLPRLGKRAVDTWELAGDTSKQESPSMEVFLDTDQTRISHSWSPTKTGATHDEALPWQTPTVLFDAREYFERSTADRIDYVFGLTDPAQFGYTDDSLIAAVNAVETTPYKVSRPIVEEFVVALRALLASRRDSIPVFLSGYVSGLKDLAKSSAASLKTLGAQLSTPKSSAPAPVDVSGSLVAARQQRDVLVADIFSARALADKEFSAVQRRSAIESELATLPKEWSELTLTKSALEDLPALSTPAAEARWREVANSLVAARVDLADSIDLQRKVGFETTCPKCGTLVLNTWLTSEIANRQQTVQSLQQQELELQAALDAARQADAALDIKRTELSARLELLRKQQQRSNNLRSELAGLSVVISEPVDIVKLESRRDELYSRVSDLESKQRAFDLWQADRDRLNASGQETQRLAVSVEVYKLAVKAVVAFQQTLIERAFATLLETAKLFTEGILFSPLVYRDGEIGRMAGDHFISWRVFSGTEEALALAGLSVALAQHAPCKVVIIDELGRLSVDNRRKLLARMVELQAAGHIDHFFGACVSSPDLDVPGVTVTPV
jgi:hypothetical protein